MSHILEINVISIRDFLWSVLSAFLTLVCIMQIKQIIWQGKAFANAAF